MVLDVSCSCAHQPIVRMPKLMEGARLGGSSSSDVYLAVNSTTGELLAVKRVAWPRESDPSAAWLSLNNEADILRDLDHPNVVQYLGSELTPSSFSMYTSMSQEVL
ncbi:hypothetical protein PENSPDRAFT_248988 [Peniophora sp. CONT]|nr:hypothetical protein PENSPDRAFT_248988 [Peniophora sp. CONT]